MTTTITLTELRQKLFQLADAVAETGEELVIVRNGVRLKLVREDAPAKTVGRLARLVKRSVVVGPPLDPQESPAEWSENVLQVAEAAARYSPRKRTRSSRP
jgi:antitoxin (DNA-binding transcriptional repressor) of toxin-antitoxin stability system